MKTQTRIQTRAQVFPVLRAPALEQVVSLQRRLAPVRNHDLCLLAGSFWPVGVTLPWEPSSCTEMSCAAVGHHSLEVSPASREM